MFHFTLNYLTVLDNGVGGFHIGPDAADLRIISFVAADDTNLPSLNEFWAASGNSAAQEAALRNLIEGALAPRVLVEVPRVRDRQTISFSPGLDMHKANFIPESFDWNFLVLRSKRSARMLGAQLGQVIDSGGIRDLSTQLLSLAGTVNPYYAAASTIAQFAFGYFAQSLKNSPDKLLGAYYASFDRMRHYPDGVQSPLQPLSDTTNNLQVKYTIFGKDPEIRIAQPVLPDSDTTAGNNSPTITISQPAVSPFTPQRTPAGLDVEAGPVVAGQRAWQFRGRPEEAFFFTGGLTVTANGSPLAYHEKDTGLASLSIAGRPGNWWNLITDAAGNPVRLDSGYYVSKTLLQDTGFSADNPARYVDAVAVPYFNLPSSHTSAAVPGDLGVIINLETERIAPAIYADDGPASMLGEASIAAAELLGIPPSPRTGGVNSGVLYIIFPGTGEGKPLPRIEIGKRAITKFDSIGGWTLFQQLFPSRVLVRRVQNALNTRGFGPLKVDGLFGPATETALILFQTHSQLTVTRKIDEDTLTALDLLLPTAAPGPVARGIAPASTSSSPSPGEDTEPPSAEQKRGYFIDHLVAMAVGEYGAKVEIPPHVESPVRRYQRATQVAPGAWPWSTAFVCWILQETIRETSARDLSPPQATDPSLLDAWAVSEKHTLIDDATALAKKGDIVIYEFPHAGFITSDQNASGDDLETIEGNTAGGNGNSDGVWSKRRPNSLRKVLIRLRDFS
ncbi:hypothetical protein DB346_08070 [Verrucomicrobia bacterium LW23]|nr:hypothetical protein DB346_08070 [Verrucomicrobia bacterium LW23]